ncbi:MAG: DUF6782 family putative metallopeptidase [Cyanobacteriota bacterium]
MRVSGNDRGCVNTLKKSATGRKLLQEAEKRGVKIEFKPDNGDSKMGQYNPNTNTITVESGNMEKMVETLGHELVHATTRENGNSMNEEKSAFIIGEKIAQEAGVNANPHSQQYWANHVDNAYKGLTQDNGILAKLYALGVDPAVNGTPLNANNTGAATNNNTAAAANPYTAAANNATGAAANPFGDNAAANNPLNPAANGQNPMMQMMMQMFMMIMQMMMRLFQMQQNNPQQQQQQNAFQDPNQQMLAPVMQTGFNFFA